MIKSSAFSFNGNDLSTLGDATESRSVCRQRPLASGLGRIGSKTLNILVLMIRLHSPQCPQIEILKLKAHVDRRFEENIAVERFADAKLFRFVHVIRRVEGRRGRRRFDLAIADDGIFASGAGWFRQCVNSKEEWRSPSIDGSELNE
jgi:hypothetical protein